jgi:hypothetical protein
MKIKIFQKNLKIAGKPLDFSKTKSILSGMALSRTQPIDRTNDAIKHKKRFKRKRRKISHN